MYIELYYYNLFMYEMNSDVLLSFVLSVTNKTYPILQDFSGVDGCLHLGYARSIYRYNPSH